MSKETIKHQIIKPNGEVYAEVWREEGKLKFTLTQYAPDLKIIMDEKVIPQLIASLQAIAELHDGKKLVKQEQDEPDSKALWQQICERCDELDAKLVKQDQDYPFGVYGAEDLDRAWKSGYDNCKAQSLWTLEDVKKAWKSGYDAAKQEQGEPVGQVSNYDTKTGFLYKDLEHGTLLYTTSQQPVIDKSSAIRIATALGWTPPNQERDESEMWATKEDFYRELDLAVNHALQQVEVKSVTMRCASGDIALPIIESRNGRILVEQVIAAQNRTWVGMTEEDFVCVHQLCDTPIQAAEYVDHLLKEKNSA